MCLWAFLLEGFSPIENLRNPVFIRIRGLCPHPASRIRMDDPGNTANADRIRLGWNDFIEYDVPALPFTGTG